METVTTSFNITGQQAPPGPAVLLLLGMESYA